MTAAKQNLLQPISIDLDNEISDETKVTFQHPVNDIVFSHEFIISELNKFDLSVEGCLKCSKVLGHFMDPKSLYDKLAEDNITWIKNPESILTNPCPNIKIPISDPKNVYLSKPDTRPRGFIKVTRIAEHIQDSGEFIKIAKGATIGVLRNLKSRPLAAKEIQFKLNQDMDSKVLISLKDFLKLDEVIDQGISQDNVHRFLTAAGLLMVFNPQSSSSQVRLCVDPSRVSRLANKSVNDSFHAGFAHIPNIAQNLIKSQFFVTSTMGDISNFYTNHHLDVKGSLLSAVFLQQPIIGSKYPTLDPNRNAPLEIYLYTGSKFGYIDAGSLACLAKTKLTKLYQEHYPDCIHKLSPSNLEQVKADLVNSYVDDLLAGATLYDIETEIKIPTFCHDIIPAYQSLRLTQRADLVTIAKALKILHVLDFAGFSIKKFQSTSYRVECTLNVDDRLMVKQTDHSNLRPDQDALRDEILCRRQKETNYANTKPAEHPLILEDQYTYLGMTISRTNDKMSLRSKPIMLRSKNKGPVDIVLRNLSEFDSFTERGIFNKSHLAALISGVYCPQQHLNAIYSNVGWKTMRYVILHSSNPLTWVTKLQLSLFPVIRKLAELYFLIQKLSIPRFCLLLADLKDIDCYVITFSDGSAEYSSACVYIISVHKQLDNVKVQLVNTWSKLQVEANDEDLTVPRNESYAAFQASEIMLKVMDIMQTFHIPVKRAILFIDAISTLISLRQHPVKFKCPLRRWFASTNINLFKAAQISGQTKEDIPLFINQTQRVNYADLLTKFNLLTDTAHIWLELQHRLLEASWLQQHPSIWLNSVLTESEDKIKKQLSGGMENFTGPGQCEEEKGDSLDSRFHLFQPKFEPNYKFSITRLVHC